MQIARLTDQQRTAALAGLPAWTLCAEGSAIERRFEFRDFSEAFAFMARVALLAEREDHHPDWSNAYNQVHVMLTTHEAGGLSGRDVAMAKAIEALL